MLPEVELLMYIYKTADMGCQGIDAVLPHVKGQELKTELTRQHKDYEHIRERAQDVLTARGEEAKGVGRAAKTSAEWMANCKLAINDSPSKIAEMTIQGTTMGITKTIKHLKDCDGGNDDAMQLGKRLLTVQQDNVERMKAYL